MYGLLFWFVLAILALVLLQFDLPWFLAGEGNTDIDRRASGLTEFLEIADDVR